MLHQLRVGQLQFTAASLERCFSEQTRFGVNVGTRHRDRIDMRNLLGMACIDDDDLSGVGDIDKEHLLLRIKHRPPRPPWHGHTGDQRMRRHIDDRHGIRVRDARVTDIGNHEEVTPRIIRQTVGVEADGDFLGSFGRVDYGIAPRSLAVVA